MSKNDGGPAYIVVYRTGTVWEVHRRCEIAGTDDTYFEVVGTSRDRRRAEKIRDALNAAREPTSEDDDLRGKLDEATATAEAEQRAAAMARLQRDEAIIERDTARDEVLKLDIELTDLRDDLADARAEVERLDPFGVLSLACELGEERAAEVLRRELHLVATVATHKPAVVEGGP